MPRIEQDARARQAAQRKQSQHRPHGQRFEGQHRSLHSDRSLGDARDEIEHDLRGWRVDRRGIIGAIDVGVDRGVAQRRQHLRAGNVKIWIDTGGLDAAVPDIAEEVVGNRRSRQEKTPHGDAGEKNGRKRAAARNALGRAAQDEPGCDRIRYGLEEEKDADLGVVEAVDCGSAGGRQHQQAARERQQRPIEAGDPFHSAAPRNASRARRSLSCELSSNDWNSARVCRGCAGRRPAAND